MHFECSIVDPHYFLLKVASRYTATSIRDEDGDAFKKPSFFIAGLKYDEGSTLLGLRSFIVGGRVSAFHGRAFFAFSRKCFTRDHVQPVPHLFSQATGSFGW